MRFLMTQLANAIFYVPTALVLWYCLNLISAFLDLDFLLIGINGLFAIMAILALISLCLPKLFPSIISKVWRLIVEVFHF